MSSHSGHPVSSQEHLNPVAYIDTSSEECTTDTVQLLEELGFDIEDAALTGEALFDHRVHQLKEIEKLQRQYTEAHKRRHLIPLKAGAIALGPPSVLTGVLYLGSKVGIGKEEAAFALGGAFAFVSTYIAAPIAFYSMQDSNNRRKKDIARKTRDMAHGLNIPLERWAVEELE